MLHMLIGANCNNNCIFCMEQERSKRKGHITSQSESSIKKMLNEYSKRDEVLFTCGEPTLNSRLGHYILEAKKLGYKTISLITNGRLIGNKAYFEKLLRLGLNKITVSIHGHNEKIHDSLTRSPGSYDQTLQGLKNCGLYKEKYLLTVNTSTVIVKQNLPYIKEIIELLQSNNIDTICLNVMMLKGRGVEYVDTLVVPYTDISKELKNILQNSDLTIKTSIKIADIPRCTVVDIDDEFFDSQEIYTQYEPEWSIGIDSENDSATLKFDEIKQQASNGQKIGGQSYYETSRSLKDNPFRLKRAECKQCKYDENCEGVWEKYIDLFGWDEFQPVITERASRDIEINECETCESEQENIEEQQIDQAGEIESIAIYGKGGIGKSVVATNLSMLFSMHEKRVLHIGCDPKADSAIRLLKKGDKITTVLDKLGDNHTATSTESIINIGRNEIHCCEAGGPPPGVGCGGRGVARTLEFLDDAGVFSKKYYDTIVFDILGDVVCGGFAAPLRKGFAKKVAIVTSEESMALYAANNISKAIDVYRDNGIVLAGIVANLKGTMSEKRIIESFAETIGTTVLATIPRDSAIQKAERIQTTIVEYQRNSKSAQAIEKLANSILAIDIQKQQNAELSPMSDEEFFKFISKW